jgi:hypothetical protein
VEAIAAPILDKEIAANVPEVLVPVVETVIQMEESKLEEAVAPPVP